jgi:hypothetical protein
MHVTVYHARGSQTGFEKIAEPADMVLAAAETRFMVLIPGGENPRDGVDPGEKKVGIRIQRAAAAYERVMELRERFMGLETGDILGVRSASTRSRNAFGPRYFQPHMCILREGNGIPRDLRPVGELFRAQMGDLHFTKFQVDISEKPLAD